MKDLRELALRARVYGELPDPQTIADMCDELADARKAACKVESCYRGLPLAEVIEDLASDLAGALQDAREAEYDARNARAEADESERLRECCEDRFRDQLAQGGI